MPGDLGVGLEGERMEGGGGDTRRDVGKITSITINHL